MPVSLVCESQSDVSSAIRNSLSAGLNGNGTHNGLNSPSSDQNIQHQFVASAKRALLNHIDYEEVSDFNNSVHDTLKSKYIVLKPPTSSSTSTSPTSTATSTSTVTSLNSNNNGKSMVNGASTDKSNVTGTFNAFQFLSYSSPSAISHHMRSQRKRENFPPTVFFFSFSSIWNIGRRTISAMPTNNIVTIVAIIFQCASHILADDYFFYFFLLHLPRIYFVCVNSFDECLCAENKSMGASTRHRQGKKIG